MKLDERWLLIRGVDESNRAARQLMAIVTVHLENRESGSELMSDAQMLDYFRVRLEEIFQEAGV